MVLKPTGGRVNADSFLVYAVVYSVYFFPWNEVRNSGGRPVFGKVFWRVGWHVTTPDFAKNWCRQKLLPHTCCQVTCCQVTAGLQGPVRAL